MMKKIDPPNQIRISYKLEGEPVVNGNIADFYQRAVNSELDSRIKDIKLKKIRKEKQEYAIALAQVRNIAEAEMKLIDDKTLLIPNWHKNALVHIIQIANRKLKEKEK